MPNRFTTIDDFFDQAGPLRAVFDDRFADPYRTDRNRFVWDNWQVPGRYAYHRTSASQYFPHDLFVAFTQRLCSWGAEHLGCDRISPPLLSYYSDRSVQHLHADYEHGVWAWVYSLTNWQGRAFEGGQTLLMLPESVARWPRAANPWFEQIDPTFNRLTVFDSHLPHGVAMVHGPTNPTQSRLVMHGWFTNPTFSARGPITEQHAAERVQQSVEQLGTSLARRLDAVEGAIIAKLQVEPNGRTSRVELLTNTLESMSPDTSPRDQVTAALRDQLRSLHFDKANQPTTMLVPIACQTGRLSLWLAQTQAIAGEIDSVTALFNQWLPAVLKQSRPLPGGDPAIIKFVVPDEPAGPWLVDLTADHEHVRQQDAAAPCTIHVHATDLLDLCRGRTDAKTAVLTGRIKVTGRADLAGHFEKIINTVGQPGQTPNPGA